MAESPSKKYHLDEVPGHLHAQAMEIALVCLVRALDRNHPEIKSQAIEEIEKIEKEFAAHPAQNERTVEQLFLLSRRMLE